ARIVVDCDVRRVTIERCAATGVEARVRSHTVTVHAKAVVVAAGSIHSPALLLRSGVRLPALGRHLALHPATAVLAQMAEPVRPWTGTVQAHYSDQFADLDHGYGFKFETAPIHPSLQALAAPWESAAGHRERMAQLPHTALVGILLRDRFGGRVTVDREGTAVAHYRLSTYDRAHLRRAIASAAELLESAGARDICVPLARAVNYRPASRDTRQDWLQRVDAAGWGPNQLLLVTFHQMASCRMGSSATASGAERCGRPGPALLATTRRLHAAGHTRHRDQRAPRQRKDLLRQSVTGDARVRLGAARSEYLRAHIPFRRPESTAAAVRGRSG